MDTILVTVGMVCLIIVFGLGGMNLYDGLLEKGINKVKAKVLTTIAILSAIAMDIYLINVF